MINRINTNVAALSARRIGEQNQLSLQKRLERISSALRINAAADDAAGLAIAERLRTQNRGMDQAQRNVQDMVSMTQVAEGGMMQISDMTQRIRNLSLQAANDTLTDGDRALIQKEVDQLTTEIDRFADTVQFNTKPLLNGDYAEGTGDLAAQAGANQGESYNLNISEMSTAALGLDNIDVSTRAGAEAAIADTDSALDTLNRTRAEIGAQQNRLGSTYNYLGVAEENMLAAESRIRDADMAMEIMGLTLEQIRGQTSMFGLAQSNLMSERVLGLLG